MKRHSLAILLGLTVGGNTTRVLAADGFVAEFKAEAKIDVAPAVELDLEQELEATNPVALDETVDSAYLHVQAIQELRELIFQSTVTTRRRGNVEFIEREEGNSLIGHGPEKEKCRIERSLNANFARHNPYASGVSFRLFLNDDSRGISSQEEEVPSVDISLDEEEYDFRVTSFAKVPSTIGNGHETWKLHAQRHSGAREIYMELDVERNRALAVFITRFEGKDAAIIKSCTAD